MSILSRRLFEPSAIFQAHVHGRGVVYLDTGPWIDLADQKTPESRECLALCRNGIAQKKLIFPVSFASISELIDQPPEANPINQAKIMDELSEGVTFRSAETIYRLECEVAFSFLHEQKVVEMDRTLLFSYVGDYLGDGYIDFPKQWNDKSVELFLNYVDQARFGRSIEQLLSDETAKEKRASHLEKGAEYRERVQKEKEEKDTETVWEKLLLSERSWVFSNIVLPRLTEQLLRGRSQVEVVQMLAKVRDALGIGSPKRLEQLMKVLPSIDLFCQVMATTRLDKNRRVKANDFYDFEHARLPPAYSDVFVTNDGFLFNILTKKCTIPKTRDCTVLRGIKAFTEYLARH